MKKTPIVGNGTYLGNARYWAEEIDGPMGSKEPADWLKVIAYALIAIAESQAVIADEVLERAEDRESDNAIARLLFDSHGDDNQ